MNLLFCLFGVHKYTMIGYEQYGDHGGYEHDEACQRCGHKRRVWTWRNRGGR